MSGYFFMEIKSRKQKFCKGFSKKGGIMKKRIVDPIKNRKQVREVEMFLAGQSKRNQLIWVFGVNTGLRISDILALNIEDVEDRDFVEIKEKKQENIRDSH